MTSPSSESTRENFLVHFENHFQDPQSAGEIKSTLERLGDNVIRDIKDPADRERFTKSILTLLAAGKDPQENLRLLQVLVKSSLHQVLLTKEARTLFDKRLEEGETPLKIVSFFNLLATLQTIFAFSDLENVVSGIFEHFSEHEKLITFLQSVTPHIEKKEDLQSFISYCTELKTVEIDWSETLDLIHGLSELLKREGIEKTLKSIALFVKQLKKSRKLYFKRAVRSLLSKEGIALMDIETAILIVKRDIYPTPEVIRKIKKMRSDLEKEGALVILSHRLSQIRETETVDFEDPVELEIFYNHLQVPIGFDEFKRILSGVSSRAIPPKNPCFPAFRISGHGVQVVTDKVNKEVVQSLQKELLSRAGLENAKGLLQKIPGLPKEILPPKLKGELLFNLVLTITGYLEKKGQTQRQIPSLLSQENVIGMVQERLLDLPPGPLKLGHLKEALHYLGQQKTFAQTLIDAKKTLPETKNLAKKNLETIQELQGKVRDTLEKELPMVTSALAEAPEAPEYLEILCESASDLVLMSSLSPADLERLCKVSNNMFVIAIKKIHLLSPEEMEELVRNVITALLHGKIGGLKNEAMIMECLEISTLLLEPGTVEDLKNEKSEVVLTACLDFFREKMPLGLKKILEDKKNCVIEKLSTACYRELSEFLFSLSFDHLKKINNAFTGALAALQKTKAKKEIQEAFQKAWKSLRSKMEKCHKDHESPPSYSTKSFRARNIETMGGSIAYYGRSNGHISKILALSEIDETSKKILNSLIEKSKKWGSMIGKISGLLEAMEQTDFLMNEGEKNPKVFAKKIRNLQMKITKDLEGFKPYSSYKEGRASIETHSKEQRKQARDRLAENFHDPEEFHRALTPALKEIDQITSKELKQLRSAFEGSYKDIVETVDEMEKILAFLERLQAVLDPVKKIRNEKEELVSGELSKISYLDLSEDEIELIPSKAPGDVFKNYISDDCSGGYRDQILNRCFVNYRMYKSIEGERTWIGNIYVLDARYEGQPVLILDAIQPSPKVSINSKTLLKGVVEGFSKIAERNRFRFVVCNKSIANVSNRMQVQQAIGEMFGGNSSLSRKGDKLKLEDAATQNSFQSFGYRGTEFLILWQHPETRPAIESKELFGYLSSKIGNDLLEKLKARRKENPFAFEMTYQNESGYQYLKSLEEDTKAFEIYLILSEKFFHDSSVINFLQDRDSCLLIKGLYEEYPEMAEKILPEFAISSAEKKKKIGQMVCLSKKDPSKTLFILLAIESGYFVSEEELLDLYACYQPYERLGLSKEFFQKIKVLSLPQLAFLKRFGSVISELEASEEGKSAAFLLLKDGAFEKPGEEEGLLPLMIRFLKLNPSREKGDTDLTAYLLNFEYKLHQGKNRAILESLVDRLERWKGAKDEGLQIGRTLLVHDLLTDQLGVGRIFDALGLVSSISASNAKQKKKVAQTLSPVDLLKLMIKDPSQKNFLLDLVKNLESSELKSIRSLFVRQFLIVRNWPKKAFVLSKVSDETLEKSYFFLFHLSEEELGGAETLETIREKFFQKHGSSKNKSREGMESLVIAGQDFCLTTKEYQDVLQAHFDIVSLQNMPHALQGKREKAEKLEKLQRELTSEEEEFLEEIEQKEGKGYTSLTAFFEDQERVYDLPFHS